MDNFWNENPDWHYKEITQAQTNDVLQGYRNVRASTRDYHTTAPGSLCPSLEALPSKCVNCPENVQKPAPELMGSWRLKSFSIFVLRSRRTLYDLIVRFKIKKGLSGINLVKLLLLNQKWTLEGALWDCKATPHGSTGEQGAHQYGDFTIPRSNPPAVPDGIASWRYAYTLGQATVMLWASLQVTDWRCKALLQNANHSSILV